MPFNESFGSPPDEDMDVVSTSVIVPAGGPVSVYSYPSLSLNSSLKSLTSPSVVVLAPLSVSE